MKNSDQLTGGYVPADVGAAVQNTQQFGGLVLHVCLVRDSRQLLS